MKAWRLAELAWVSKHGRGNWPEEFTWRGRRRKVRSIESYLPPHDQDPTTETARSRRFQLKTEDGLTCVLSHDLQRDRWTVDALCASPGGTK